MTHEYFVSKEIAELLEKAGFNWESHFTCKQQQDEWLQSASIEVPNPHYNEALPFSSPTNTVVLPHVTQAEARRWLREVKKIDMIIEFAVIDDMEVPYSYDLWIADKEYASKGSWRTYEAAEGACIQKCLTLILEEKQ